MFNVGFRWQWIPWIPPSHEFWIQLRLKRSEVVEERHLKDQNHPKTWMVIYILVQMDGLFHGKSYEIWMMTGATPILGNLLK